MINFIIWNESPVLFSIGSLAMRWYGILFILGFVISRQILIYIYKKEGKPTGDVEILTRYIFIAILIGSRLGYVIFYEPELILSKPREILLPIAFQPSFHFTGLEKLSGHGAVLGIFIALWLYSRKNKPGQNYIQLLDRVAIVILLTGVFISIGNFLNSEVIGEPTTSKAGVVFTRPVADGLLKVPCCIMRNPGGNNPLDFVTVRKDTALITTIEGHSPILLYLFFKPGATEQLVNEFLIGDVKTYLYDKPDFIYESGAEPLHYTIFQEKLDIFTARIRTVGIARHPTSVYESVSYLILFAAIFLYWHKFKANIVPGRIFGFYLIGAWGLNFIYGYFKVRQVAFEDGMMFNMEQILSIPFFVIGLVLLFYSYRRGKADG